MRFHSEYPQWEMHSQLPHSASNILYLGANKQGWDKLKLTARFENNGKMVNAIESACVNMLCPDEDSDALPKRAKGKSLDEKKTFLIAVQDLELFLNQLSACKCITDEDVAPTLKKISDLKQRSQNKNILPQQDLTATDNHGPISDSLVY